MRIQFCFSQILLFTLGKTILDVQCTLGDITKLLCWTKYFHRFQFFHQTHQQLSEPDKVFLPIHLKTFKLKSFLKTFIHIGQNNPSCPAHTWWHLKAAALNKVFLPDPSHQNHQQISEPNKVFSRDRSLLFHEKHRYLSDAGKCYFVWLCKKYSLWCCGYILWLGAICDAFHSILWLLWGSAVWLWRPASATV